MTTAIVYALKEEVRGLLQKIKISHQVSKHRTVLSFASYQETPLVFCQTGVGMANAHEGAEVLFQHVQPDLILSLGCAGSTQPFLKTGDLIIANEIRSETPSDLFLTETDASHRMIKICQEGDSPCHVGPLMTLWKLADKKKKIEISQKGIYAVDMETAALAAIANRRKVPLLSLRAIFDPMEEELPFTEPYDENHPVRHFLRNPKMILKIPRYFQMNQLCQKNLAQVVMLYLKV